MSNVSSLRASECYNDVFTIGLLYIKYRCVYFNGFKAIQPVVRYPESKSQRADVARQSKTVVSSINYLFLDYPVNRTSAFTCPEYFTIGIVYI